MRVKSLIFFIAILLSVHGLQAQKKKKPVKPSLAKIEAFVNKSKSGTVEIEELLKTKEISDLSATYEKTKGKSKTWYLRGFVYKLIYEREEDVAGITKTEALQTSIDGFNKAVEIGGESDTYTFVANNEIEGLWSSLVNSGVENYNEGNNEEAAQDFEYVALIKPNDTTGHLYAAASSQEYGNFERAIKNYKNLVKISPKAKYYTVIIALQKQELKDLDAAMATISEAKSQLGEDNVDINKYEIDILIARNEIQSAVDKLDKAIANEPENPVLFVRQGLLFDRIVTEEKKKDEPNEESIKEYQTKAEEAYLGALKADPTDITANFNYAVILSNKANVFFNEYNLMSPAEARKRGDEVKSQGVDIISKAIPYMKNALEKQPDDKDILYALQSFYNKVGDKENLKKIGDKLTSLGYEN